MIKVYLNGIELPRLEIPFLQTPLENSRDVETLDGNVHSDFISLERQWSISYSRLTKEQYDQIRDIYESQFETGNYPTLTIDEYNVDEVPVRMRLNTKNIKNWGKFIDDVEITLRETVQLTIPDLTSS